MVFDLRSSSLSSMISFKVDDGVRSSSPPVDALVVVASVGAAVPLSILRRLLALLAFDMRKKLIAAVVRFTVVPLQKSIEDGGLPDANIPKEGNLDLRSLPHVFPIFE